MLDGLTSRWITPARWAAATCPTIITALSRRFKRSVGEDRFQIAAVNESHVDVEATVDLTEVVDRHDMRLVEHRRRTRLTLETLPKLAVGGQVRRQHLDRDHPGCLGVVGAPHFPMPPRPSNCIKRYRPNGVPSTPTPWIRHRTTASHCRRCRLVHVVGIEHSEGPA